MPASSGFTVPAPTDFWRDQAAGALPDGVQDTTEGIKHPGVIHVGASAAGAAHATTHVGICEYRGQGTFQTQTIQTTIPAASQVMPTIRVRGNGYSEAALIDLSIGFYDYSGPQLYNPFWTSHGTVQPSLVRIGYVGGFVAIELTWPDAGGYYFSYTVDAVAVQPSTNNAWFQNWTVASAVMVGPTGVLSVQQSFPMVSPTTFSLVHLDGLATYSDTNELAWTGSIRYMGPGQGGDLGQGMVSFDPLPVGTVVPVSGLAPRTVTAAGTGHALGGLVLNRYETLWGFQRTGSGTVLASDYRVQPFNQISAMFAPPPAAGLRGRWLPVAIGMEASVKLADGSVITQGGRVGRHSHLQLMNDFRQENGAQLLGYTFSPAVGVFGFTGKLFVGFGTGGHLVLSGSFAYIDAPAAGTVARGFGPATSKTWRVMTAAERPYEFGEVYGGSATYDLSATTAVIDLDNYDSLYWVPAAGGATSGYFAIRTYYDTSVVPSHWFRIATKLPWVSNWDLQMWNGRRMTERQCLWAGSQDQEARTARAYQQVTSTGEYSCRLTHANAFAGTGVDGVDGTGQTNGAYIGWLDGGLIAGMHTAISGESNYLWLHMPAAGTDIPILGSGVSRRVVDIGGVRHVGLNSWQSLVYIPAAIGAANAAAARGWVIVDYTRQRYLPMHAIVAVQNASVGNHAGTAGANGTHYKMADGTYVHPGLIVPKAPGVLNDQGQGTGTNWRPIVLAGQTPPGTGTSVVPAVAAISAGGDVPSVRIMASGSVSQPLILLRGTINVSGYVPDNTIIAVIPGQHINGSAVRVQVPAFHGTNFAVPATAVLELTNNSISGTSGILVRVFGLSLANLSAQNGGPQAPGGFISLDGITLQRA